MYWSFTPACRKGYLSYSNNGHRNETVSLTEARTEIIHGQHESCSLSIWLAYSNLTHPRRKIFLVSCVCVINTENFTDKKQKNTANRETKTSNLPAEMNGLFIARPGQIACFARSMPSLVVAGQSAVSRTPGERRVVLMSFQGLPRRLLEMR